MLIPRILVIDDFFGRNVPAERNTNRENLCAHFLWQDVTGDAASIANKQKIINPLAEVVFFRGQSPTLSDVGSLIENDLEGSLNVLRKGWTAALAKGEPPWSMVLLDLCFYTGRVTEASNLRNAGMPEGRPGDDDPNSYFGLTLLEVLHRKYPELPVMILSSKPREEVSLQFSRRGAIGFIDRSDLRGPDLLKEALWYHGLLPDPENEVIGNSLPILLALREGRRATHHNENLLIRGERGTGKELMARYVQRVTKLIEGRNKRPFVTVNSAVLTSNLFASELFGIEPKTATGVDGKIGLIEAAVGGDLFLDEIADMPSEVQAAVLRVLQERQFTTVGGRHPKEADVRFLSATNADLESEARNFRPDLLDRLRLGGTLWLVPLRERRTDIPLLVEKFVREAEGQRLGIMKREITPESLDLLIAHGWPGNIRELRTCLFDAVNRYPDVEHLVPAHLRIGSKSDKGGIVVSLPQKEDVIQEQVTPRALDLAGFLEIQTRIWFEQRDIAQWSGRLADLQRTYDCLLARYLRAALEATKRRTSEHPEGIIQIHPAVKLMTGDGSLTASKAADIVKRLLGPLEGELDGDLDEAYKIAVRLRPKSPPKTGSSRNRSF